MMEKSFQMRDESGEMSGVFAALLLLLLLCAQ